MTDDRELLELAALAGGIELEYENGTPCKVELEGTYRKRTWWNPRNRSGDALDLAVGLGIRVVPYPIFGHEKHSVIASRRWFAPPDDDERTYVGPEVIELYGDDRCAATRLAITRAAAEIGRQMREAA